MRELRTEELGQVSGAGKSSYDDCCCESSKPPKHKKSKGNNGFGNGGHDGIPGNSGKQDNTR